MHPTGLGHIMSEFLAINFHRPLSKKINHDHTDTLKKRTKTTVTPSVFGQQPSWWHRHVAAIAAHSAIPHIVVTTPPFESCSLPSAKKIVYFQRQTRGPPVITAMFHPPLSQWVTKIAATLATHLAHHKMIILHYQGNLPPPTAVTSWKKQDLELLWSLP